MNASVFDGHIPGVDYIHLILSLFQMVFHDGGTGFAQIFQTNALSARHLFLIDADSPSGIGQSALRQLFQNGMQETESCRRIAMQFTAMGPPQNILRMQNIR